MALEWWLLASDTGNMSQVWKSLTRKTVRQIDAPGLATEWSERIRHMLMALFGWLMAVPIRVKIAGVMLLPVLILGFTIYLWVRAALSDWLSWLLNSEQVDAAMQAGGRSVLLVTVLALGLSLLLSSALIVVLTHPILELKRIADQVRRGGLDQRAPVHGGDEIGQVAESFNRMLDKLVQSQRELESSNRRLGSLLKVAESVGHDLELSGVLEAALASTLDAAGLDSGWIYLREPGSQRYYLATAVKAPASVTQMPWSAPPALCSCQQELMDSDEWSGATLRECRRLDSSEGEVQVRHLSLPLKARGLRLGMMNMLWYKPELPNTEHLELIDAIGAQVSEAVANARLHADLLEKEAGMEILLHSLVTAQEDERSLIAAELHDGAGQELTSVLLRLKTLEAKDDVETLKSGIAKQCASLSQAIEHIRTLSHQLRPPDLEQLGLGPTIRNLTRDMMGDNGFEVSFESDLDGYHMDPTIEITLYRIAQEALTNITKHADAANVSLKLLRIDDELLLEIEDDGVGFNPDDVSASGALHLGLASIQERVERLTGSFVVRTAPGHGTRLSICVPFNEVTT